MTVNCTTSIRRVEDYRKNYINYLSEHKVIRPKAMPSSSSKSPTQDLPPTDLKATWIVWCEVLFLWVTGSFMEPLPNEWQCGFDTGCGKGVETGK